MRPGSRSILGVLLMAAVACDHGGGSPTAPPPPESTVEGLWNGSGTLTRVSGVPHNHCIEDHYVLGATSNVAADVDLSGGVDPTSNVSVAVYRVQPFTFPDDQCTFQGTISGRRLSATLQACDWGLPPNFFLCNNEFIYEIRALSGSLEGSFDESLNNFEGTHRLELRAIEATVGHDTIDFSFRTSVALTKQ